MLEPVQLGVNLDHVATLRQARCTAYPDPVYAAFVAADAGADGITLHLREDRRHIQDHDVKCVRERVHKRLNLEMAATEEMARVAHAVAPDDCCLVPERRAELTTEGGLDVCASETALRKTCAYLTDNGIRVSLFVDADHEQIAAAERCGAAAVEIHTGPYADAQGEAGRRHEREVVAEAVAYAESIGLRPNAGHGLDYNNVREIASIEGVRELNIGHAIIARAVITGLSEAVREMKQLVRNAR